MDIYGRPHRTAPPAPRHPRRVSAMRVVGATAVASLLVAGGYALTPTKLEVATDRCESRKPTDRTDAWVQTCIEAFMATPDADLVYGVDYR